jgi:hypothetical protein
MQLPVAITSVLDAALEHLYGLKPLVEPTIVLGTTETGNLAGQTRESSFIPFRAHSL